MTYSTGFAGVIDKELMSLYEKLNASAKDDGISNMDELNIYLGERSAKYLLEKFDYVEVTRGDKVFGLNGNDKTLLLEEEDSKMFIDAMTFEE